MSRLDALLGNVGRMSTRMGQAFVGRRAVFRGHDLHAELKDMDWLELFVFGITGRRFDAARLRLLHAMWVYTSYPDARIWNNRIAALAASARSTPALGISAALAVSEATIYGGHPFVRGIDFLMQAQRRVEEGQSVEAVVADELRQRRIYGYGRPLDCVDERLPWLLALAAELGLDQGPHLRLSLEVEQALVQRHPRLRMNYAGLTAALAADLGFSVREFHHFTVPIFMAGMSPCFIEGSERAEGAVFPVPCERVRYEGPAKRRWGAATAGSSPAGTASAAPSAGRSESTGGARA